VLLRRKLTLVLMAVMMLMMSAAPALAVSTHVNEGNKAWDGGDKNLQRGSKTLTQV
jgi:hypothetical protein